MLLKHDRTREIDEYSAESHRKKKRRLHLLADGKIDKQQANRDHYHLVNQFGVHTCDSKQ